MGPRFLVVTAFDAPYEVGYLCSTVNEAYCKKHGYTFRRYLLPAEDMARLSGSRHCAWGKVALVYGLLGGELPAAADLVGERADDFDYVVWIDADAIVVDHDVRLEDFVSLAADADFIIGEDMADTDTLNTGLFLCRTKSPWMLDVMRMWWEDSDPRWFHEVCWDQTGICRLLDARGIMRKEHPWFSWQGGRRRKAFHEGVFVFDCGAFNFKYINNCGFVFHAVGAEELLFSCSRVLQPKRERLYAVVHEGFITGGVPIPAGSSTDGPCCAPPGTSALERLREARRVWNAHGVAGRGLANRGPPLAWVAPAPLRAGRSVPACSAGRASASAPLVRQHLVGAQKPLVVVGAWEAPACVPARRGVADYWTKTCGDVPVPVVRCSPVRGTDVADGATLHHVRLWQLCEYALGRACPFGPLCFLSDTRTWRAHGWRPWAKAGSSPESDPLMEHLQAWIPPSVASLDGFAPDDESGGLDVEPPGSVTRCHRAQAGSHCFLAVLDGEMELLLFPPEAATFLEAGAGTCDPDQSAWDPLASGALAGVPPDLQPMSARLRRGDLLVVPGGWWCWSRALAACTRLRRSFVDRGTAHAVASWHALRTAEIHRRTRPAPARVGEVEAACRASAQGLAHVHWFPAGTGAAALPGHFVALHFVVYTLAGKAIESSYVVPHPCVVEASAGTPGGDAQRHASTPLALREVRRRGLLCAPEAGVGARCGFLAQAGGPGSEAPTVVVVVEILEILERHGGRLRGVPPEQRVPPPIGRPAQLGSARCHRGACAFSCRPRGQRHHWAERSRRPRGRRSKHSAEPP